MFQRIRHQAKDWAFCGTLCPLEKVPAFHTREQTVGLLRAALGKSHFVPSRLSGAEQCLPCWPVCVRKLAHYP